MKADIIGIGYGLVCTLIGAILGFYEGNLRDYRKCYQEELESKIEERHGH